MDALRKLFAIAAVAMVMPFTGPAQENHSPSTDTSVSIDPHVNYNFHIARGIQSPPFMEFQGEVVDQNHDFYLRCGYFPQSRNKKTADPSFAELTLRDSDQDSHRYGRYESIGAGYDRKIIVIGPDPLNSKRALVQTVTSDVLHDYIQAQNCVYDFEKNSISSCTESEPFLTVSRSRWIGDLIVNKCDILVPNTEIKLEGISYKGRKFDEQKQEFQSHMKANLAALGLP